MLSMIIGGMIIHGLYQLWKEVYGDKDPEE